MYQRAANKLGMPVEQVRKVMYLVEKRVNALQRTDGRFILRNERRLAKRIEPLFNKQMEYFIEQFATLSIFNRKITFKVIEEDTEDEIRQIVENKPEDDHIMDAVVAVGGLLFLRGAFRTRKELGVNDENDFVSIRDAASYFNELTNLHLSQRNGSISATTNLRIVDILRNGIQENQTYTQIANEIRKQGKAGVFSKARAQMIAVDQLSNAYAHGQTQQVERYINQTGAIIEKLWSTVGDEKVDQFICAPNERQGWIPYRASFQSGDDWIPGHINCRCTIITRQIN